MLARISYYQLKSIIEDNDFPMAMVDLDAIDKNLDFYSQIAKKNNKKIRIASKSIRVPYLLKYLFEKEKDLFSGIMCYRMSEAKYLNDMGFNDLLLAYPDTNPKSLKTFVSLTKSHCNISMVVDSIEHLQAVDDIAKENNLKLDIILELDGSLKMFDSKVNLGVRRSSIKSLNELKDRIWFIQRKKNLNLKGIMLYEAQVAGLADNSPWNVFQNPFKRKIKEISVPKVEEFRAKSVEMLKENGFNPEIINGGGSGSIYSSVKDNTINEIAVGSGFLCSHLFSYYDNLSLTPAIFFAIPIVRKSDEDYITCLGGGLIASGSIGKDRQPEVFLPKGLESVDIEGFGEVQTPFKVIDKKLKINIGDPIILRHAKAGELAEHFNHYYIFKDNKIIDKQPTYRGLGYHFL
ncbi:MAG: alanine racemase [Candidatus Sericytochromatia bacterium]